MAVQSARTVARALKVLEFIADAGVCTPRRLEHLTREQKLDFTPSQIRSALGALQRAGLIVREDGYSASYRIGGKLAHRVVLAWVEQAIGQEKRNLQ